MLKYSKIDVGGHAVLRIDVTGSTAFLAKAEQQARLKADRVHEDDPAGNPRSYAEKLSQNFLGVLADMVCAEILRSYFQKHGIPITIERYDDVRTDNFENHDLYDIRLINQGREVLVEVRSSSCILLSVEAMVRRWQILGPYVSTAKGSTETDKPFYMRVLYHLADFERNRTENFYSRSQGISYVKNGDLQLYFVGGATLDLLKKFGRNERGEEMKQGKSEFRVLNITEGLDAQNFLETIAKAFSN